MTISSTISSPADSVWQILNEHIVQHTLKAELGHNYSLPTLPLARGTVTAYVFLGVQLLEQYGLHVRVRVHAQKLAGKVRKVEVNVKGRECASDVQDNEEQLVQVLPRLSVLVQVPDMLVFEHQVGIM
ncbi:hypothetical protein HWV62_15457 [Athelia sp. TMB]|nr:hypothetical protein HWV62_15457 [Athelia sp. TMB]